MKTVDNVNNFKCCTIEWKNDILLIWKCGLEDYRYEIVCFNKEIVKKKNTFLKIMIEYKRDSPI